MKKLFLVLAVCFSTIFLISCGAKEEIAPAKTSFQDFKNYVKARWRVDMRISPDTLYISKVDSMSIAGGERFGPREIFYSPNSDVIFISRGTKTFFVWTNPDPDVILSGWLEFKSTLKWTSVDGKKMELPVQLHIQDPIKGIYDFPQKEIKIF